MTTGPLAPDIDEWLRSSGPRQELVLRLAMRERFPTVRANKPFGYRIEELWGMLNPERDENYTAEVLADTRMMANSIERLLNEKRGGLAEVQRPRSAV